MSALLKSSTGFVKHLLLISQFEIKRLLMTRKGGMTLLTFAVVWLLILYYPIRFASSMVRQGQQSVNIFRIFEFFKFDFLMVWQIPEFGVFWAFALLIFPTMSLFLAADQTCSDREQGTLRILALRTTRERLFFGRFSGAMLVQTLLIVVALVCTLLLVMMRDPGLFAEGLNSMLAIIVNLVITILPFTAMMALLSSLLKSARQATLWAVLILMFMSGVISIFSQYLPALDVLKHLIPGYQFKELGRLAQWDTLQIAHVPLLQTLVLLGIGYWLMRRQAL